MALNVPNPAQNTNTKNANNANPQQGAPYTQPSRPGKTYGQGYSSPEFGLKNRLASSGSGGEVYEKLFSYIGEKVKIMNEDVKLPEKYALVKLLKDVHGLRYSGIVICETLSDVTAVHILMVEKTGDNPEPLIETIGNKRYELLRTPADALDDDYVMAVKKAVRDALGIAMESIVVTDGTLVPRELDMADTGLLDELIDNSVNAIYSEIETRVKGYEGFNLVKLIESNRQGKFSVSLHFNPETSTLYDQTGTPIRQDVCVALSYKNVGGQNSKSINQGSDTVDLVKTYGYIDFEWVGPPMPGQDLPTRKFMPNFIITHIDSPMAITPDILMMGVVSVITLNEDMNWMQAFRPVHGGMRAENDIGALNVEGNIMGDPSGFGKKANTKKGFETKDLNTLIQTLVRQNLVVSYDIPYAGPNTWFSSVLRWTKFNNDATGLAAVARINKYVANMTNGAYVPSDTPMFNAMTNKIHGGFYKVGPKEVRDLRHLSSYLGFANHIADTNESGVRIGTEYTNTLYDNSVPSELRAADRKRAIDTMSNGSAVYKQFYDRVTFNPVYLAKVSSAMRQVGFAPFFSNMGGVNDMFVRRSNSDFASAALTPDMRITGQSNPYSGFYGGQNYGRTF